MLTRPSNAAKPWGRDFTTSRAWAEDELREAWQSDWVYFFSSLGTAAFSLCLFTGAFVVVKRIFTFLLPHLLPSSWLAS
jgi:hypothetical protein